MAIFWWEIGNTAIISVHQKLVIWYVSVSIVGGSPGYKKYILGVPPRKKNL
jgi:hypothetical protein